MDEGRRWMCKEIIQIMKNSSFRRRRFLTRFHFCLAEVRK